jgi:hypothetical protein
MSAVAFSGHSVAAVESVMPVATGHGAGISARQGQLSGRPSCRIFRMGKGWGLAIERNSAWLIGFGIPGSCRFFRSLRAAIAFAEARGLDYYVVRPARPFESYWRRRWRGRGRGRDFGRPIVSKASSN